MRGISGESRTIINSQGVRGSEMPTAANRRLILCLGASSTNCTYLDQSETWPAVLERELQTAGPTHNYWVGNVGIPSLTTEDHLRFLIESDLPRQMDCIVLQTGINDFMQAIAPTASPSPLWIRSNLWQLMTSVARRYLNSPDVVIEDAAGASYVRRRAERVAAPKMNKLPNVSRPLSAYADRLRAIIARCRELNVNILVTSQPVLWTADVHPKNESLLWFGRTASNQFLATPQLRAGMNLFNQVTQQVCEELGVEFVDLSDLNGRDDVFYDDCHFTEEGARQVAQRVAERLAIESRSTKTLQRQPGK
jgi:lysophospholipase L1-like esterase